MPRLAPLKKSPRVAPNLGAPAGVEGADLSPIALEVEDAQPKKTSFVMRASRTGRPEPVVAALRPDGDSEVTVDDVMKCAKDHAERELRKVHESRRVSAIIRAGHADGSIDAQLRKQLATLDEDGDGEISNEEVVHFCKNFAQQQLVLAEEQEAHEAAKQEARQLRTRLVGCPRGSYFRASRRARRRAFGPRRLVDRGARGRRLALPRAAGSRSVVRRRARRADVAGAGGRSGAAGPRAVVTPRVEAARRGSWRVV